MFYVRKWDGDEVISEHKALAAARKAARGWGHVGYVPDGCTSYPPVAYVANENGECVYNPHFPSTICLGGLLTGPEDCLRG